MTFETAQNWSGSEPGHGGRRAAIACGIGSFGVSYAIALHRLLHLRENKFHALQPQELPRGVTNMAAQGSSECPASASTWQRRGLNAAHRCMRALSRLRRAQSGVSAVEVALAAPILIALTTGVVDLGLALSAQIRVQQAAQAGAAYAQLHGFDTTKISSAVTSATALSVSASPAASETCGCISGSSVTLSGSAPCTNTCANGLTAGTYVQVHASYSYTPLVSWSVLSNPTSLTGYSLVRVQ